MKVLSLFVLLSVSIASNVYASQVYEKKVLTVDSVPCSRTIYKNFAGVKIPTIQLGRKLVSAIVSVGHQPHLSLQSLQAADNECIGVGLLAATGLSILTSPAVFSESFYAAYSTCMYARIGGELTGIALRFEAECRY